MPHVVLAGCSGRHPRGDDSSADHDGLTIGGELERIGLVARDFSWRNDAVRHLDIAFSENWAGSNLSYYVHDKHGYDISMVINREDETVYSQVDGRTAIRRVPSP